MSKKRIPFATGGWVNTQSSGDTLECLANIYGYTLTITKKEK